MHRYASLVLVALAALGFQASQALGGEFPIPRAPDSDAPAGSPPHWLPNEHWVHDHYLPFDEARLYTVLRTSRDGLWKWLRDDNHTIEELARTKGWQDTRALAVRLIENRQNQIDEAITQELLARTIRILRQGHLSQHIIFHSLHQESGPSAAKRLFGVAPGRFQALRRLDISPLQIGRMHGRTRAQMQSGLEDRLEHAIHHGIEMGEISERQGMTLLHRQLRQVPRWLGEEHYNGPPQTVAGKPKYPFRASFASPALSGDASTVFFDAAQPTPPLAVKFGEVNLAGMDLGSQTALTPRDVSATAQADAPCSSFNADVSADGQTIAYEIGSGNRTFAKRYGNVAVALGNLQTHALRRVAGGARGKRVTTAYNPSVSADGRVVAYVSVSADPMAMDSDTATRVRIYDGSAGTTTVIPVAGAYEPEVSGNGRYVVFTAFAADGPLQVWRFERATRTVSQVSSGAGEAWAPAVSDSGRRVAYAASTHPGRSRIWLRDMDEKAAVAITPVSAGFVDAPAISGDGAVLAYTRSGAGARTSPLGRPLQSIFVRSASGGGPAVRRSGVSAWSGQPQLSGDGNSLAYTTDEGTPATGPGGLRVFVSAGENRQVSPDVAATTFDGGGAALDPGTSAVCDLRSPAW